MRSNEGLIIEEKEIPEYTSIIEEAVEDWSYLKFPYYSKEGYPAGMYRVGPLARVNVADGISTPLAGEAMKDFKDYSVNGVVDSSMFYHYARMIEVLYALEKARFLLEDKKICSTDIFNASRHINSEGIGITEAPRGTLIHHYQVDDRGAIQRCNLIVATGHNNLAMNKSVLEVAKKYIKRGEVREGILNRIEVAIRCYDPCLSCATHALGQMPLQIKIVSHEGELIKEISR